VFSGLFLRELCCGTNENGLVVALDEQCEDKLVLYCCFVLF